MPYSINETHDPSLTSWVESANAPDGDFPIQNLPFGVFRAAAAPPRVGVAIGDQILDLTAALQAGLISGAAAEAGAAPSLNGLLALGRAAWSDLRSQISRLLRAGSPAAAQAAQILAPIAQAELLVPMEIGDYTDFYASIFHATNIGSMFRPDNPLLPNYKYVPIGYHGRASSIVASGTPVRRPLGQTKPADAAEPRFGPSALLDYELEIGSVVGPGNDLGSRIAIDEAEERIFGLCLLNDWSARDIQAWEYQPLGPFLAKNFATSVGPWVVSLEALEPYRCAAFARQDGDPAPLPYLESAANQARGGVDLILEVSLRSQAMREQDLPPQLLSRGNFRDMYWTIAQMLTHHASNGCNLRPGDLLGSGTISGPAKSERGCMMELTWRGSEPVELPGGETRRFLNDGDELIMRGFCAAPGKARIGFGSCSGVVLGVEGA